MNPRKHALIVYVVLIFATLAVFWQVNQFEFVNFDDGVYVTQNNHIGSGITLKGIKWAFGTTNAEFWHPLTWLSLMLDYQIFGLNAGGYHITNLIFHIMSTLLLFWLFKRMTGALWRSAFIAGLFAFHPLHVESVAWISERKDVLSAFFWMLTLCLYVYYTEKPDIKRYLLVLLCFVLGLMSKPMAVTLPVIMILLDYWPLGRFQSKQNESGMTRHCGWQLREKAPFFVLSAIFSILALYAQYKPFLKKYPLELRLANAPVSFITYLGKTFWPHKLAVFYPFSDKLPLWQVLGCVLLILIISAVVIVKIKKSPHLFVGWFWYTIILLPVIGIIQVGEFSMADRYTYLPLTGIGIMLVWGIPLFFPSEEARRKILLPVSITILIVLALLTWKQLGYWKNNSDLFKHAWLVTKENSLVHINLGQALLDKGKFKEAIVHYNIALSIKPGYYISYNNRGIAYAKLGQIQRALDDFNEAIRLRTDYAEAYINRGNVYAGFNQYKQRAIEDYNEAIRLKPDYADAYINRGNVYADLNQYQRALEDYKEVTRLRPDHADNYNNRGIFYIEQGDYPRALEDFNKAIRLAPRYADTYNNRGTVYAELGEYQRAIDDFNEAIKLNHAFADAYNNRGSGYVKIGQNQPAIEDYNEAIRLMPNHADAYNNRAAVYLNQGDKKLGCQDAQKSCELGICKTLEAAQARGDCR